MSDRHADGYQPNFDIDAAAGRQAELYVKDVADALAHGASVEVKRDDKFAETGNVYFEYECRTWGGTWKPSGIAVTEAELWVHVVQDDIAFVLPTWKVKAACRLLHARGYKRECGRGSNPTKGICAPLLIFLAAAREAATASDQEKAA